MHRINKLNIFGVRTKFFLNKFNFHFPNASLNNCQVLGRGQSALIIKAFQQNFSLKFQQKIKISSKFQQISSINFPFIFNSQMLLSNCQVLGRGQSALIIKAEDTFNYSKPLAIKVLHKVYKPIGSQEADILLELHKADPYHHVPFARVKTQFLYGPHYCLVFDALSPTSLYTHYELKDIRGASSLAYIRQLAVRLFIVMGFLRKQNVIHADLKPENILLSDEKDLNSVMVVDFGNALRNTEEELSLYYSDFELQTLLYRAPEVIFGLRFSLEVDMWSLGCLLAECYIGKPLFMGKTKSDILSKVGILIGSFIKVDILNY